MSLHPGRTVKAGRKVAEKKMKEEGRQATGEKQAAYLSPEEKGKY